MEIGKLQDFTIDQFAGSLALILGSRCECDMNCCYLIRCHRKPPPPDNQDSDEEQPNQEQQPIEPANNQVQ